MYIRPIHTTNCISWGQINQSSQAFLRFNSTVFYTQKGKSTTWLSPFVNTAPVVFNGRKSYGMLYLLAKAEYTPLATVLLQKKTGIGGVNGHSLTQKKLF